MNKLKSRKFWLCVASLLGSVAAAIAGFAIDSQTIAIIGVICGVASAAIYEVVEAVVDCENSGKETES